MKNFIGTLVLSASVFAAEDGLLHQWHFRHAKEGAIPARVGKPARYSGEAEVNKVGQVGWLSLKGTERRAWVTDNFRTAKFPAKAITVEA